MTPPSWTEVETIFHEATQLPPHDRSAFLDRVCAGNSLLRGEVESLLACFHSAGEFLESPLVGQGVSLLEQNAQDARIGKNIGPYCLLRLLGQGGMGAVYLAERADDVYHKQVAIKLIRPGSTDHLILERFHTERQILASLEYSNIARLLDGGTTEEGQPYIVMEYVEGQPIDRYCEERQLPIEQRLNLFLQVCAAVQYAHQNLIIHRDIKCGNILVNAEGIPKLLDFGIAKLLNPEGMTLLQLHSTSPGLLLLTPDYSSPEQARGEPVNTTTDVYSLGVLLYRILTGRPPYQLSSSNPAELVRIISEVHPPKPSLVVRQFEPLPVGTSAKTPSTGDFPASQPVFRKDKWQQRRLRGDLDNITLMALRKEPSRRYASVDQLAADIRRHLEGLPVLARPGTWIYRTSKFLRRNRWGVLAAGLLFIVLSGGILATWRQARIAAQERDRARVEASKAQEITAFLQKMLSSADPHWGGKNVTVSQVLDQASQRIEQELPNQPAIEAAVRTTIGLAYLSLGLYSPAEMQIKKSLQIRGRLYGPEHIDVAMNLHHLSLIYLERGEATVAEPLSRQALRLIFRARGESTLETASILNTLAELRLRQGDLDEAERLHRRALDIRRKLVGEHHADVAESLNDLAIVLGTRGHFQEAEPLHAEALEIIRSLRGHENLEVAVTMGNLAGVKAALKKYDEAESLFQESLTIRRKILGPAHPDVAWTLFNYAFMMMDKGSYPQAITLSSEVLSLRGTTLPEIHPMVAGALHVRGRSLMAGGRLEEALRDLTQSLQLRRRMLPPEHWLIANSESVWGECLGKLGRKTESELLLCSSYEKLNRRLGPHHDRTREALLRVIQFYASTGEKGKEATYRHRLGS